MTGVAIANSMVRQLNEGSCEVENQYRRVVVREGNRKAQALMEEVFELLRGIVASASALPALARSKSEGLLNQVQHDSDPDARLVLTDALITASLKGRTPRPGAALGDGSEVDLDAEDDELEFEELDGAEPQTEN